MILSDYLPTRSPADRAAERLRLRLGGEEFVLPVLSIEENEAWVATFGQRGQALLSGITAIDDAASVFARLGAATGLQIDLLRAYDTSGVLPDDDWIRKHASGDALLSATMEVLACAFPLAAVVLDMVARNPDTIRKLINEGLTRTNGSAPTSSAPPSTAGRRAKSAGA